MSESVESLQVDLAERRARRARLTAQLAKLATDHESARDARAQAISAGRAPEARANDKLRGIADESAGITDALAVLDSEIRPLAERVAHEHHLAERDNAASALEAARTDYGAARDHLRTVLGNAVHNVADAVEKTRVAMRAGKDGVARLDTACAMLGQPSNVSAGEFTRLAGSPIEIQLVNLLEGYVRADVFAR